MVLLSSYCSLYSHLFFFVWSFISCVVLGVASTVGPTKSDSDEIFFLQLLSETLTCSLHDRSLSANRINTQVKIDYKSLITF